MTKIVALDTETTGLDPATCEVWDVAMVNLDPLDEWDAQEWHLPPSQYAIDTMHPKAAEVNRFHERTSDPGWTWDEPGEALDEIAYLLDGAHIVGAVPDFDTRFLTALFARHGRPTPRWHYHLIDVETLAIGFLSGRNRPRPELPWNSDELTELLGLAPVTDDERHTAIGDARWAARIYRQIAGRPAVGDHVTDGGWPGTIISCDQCSGDGVLHDPDDRDGMMQELTARPEA